MIKNKSENSNRNIILILLLAVFFSGNLLAQKNKKQKLEKDKKQIEKEISYTNKLLTETKKSRTSSIEQLVILNNKIGHREALISTISREVQGFGKQIKSGQENINQLTEDLKKLKEEYAQMIYHAYKNRSSYDLLMFLFSSEDFNQAYQRLKYLQQYSSYRKNQVELIQQKQAELNEQIKENEALKANKVKLLDNEKIEKSQLNAERNENNSTVKQLRQKEGQLLASLRVKQKATLELQRQIQKIIDAERRRLAEEKKASKMKIGLTPKEMELSKTFATNKGRLPWPSQRGIISSSFGPQKHPILKDIVIDNDGIDILTNEGSVVRAVFSGTVSAITRVTNYNYLVIIRHGEYLTVYINLIKVYVKAGDEVQTKQNIGLVFTNIEESKTEFKFQLWKGNVKLNPEYWLAKNH